MHELSVDFDFGWGYSGEGSGSKGKGSIFFLLLSGVMTCRIRMPFWDFSFQCRV
jgi:hypothetical protein